MTLYLIYLKYTNSTLGTPCHLIILLCKIGMYLQFWKKGKVYLIFEPGDYFKGTSLIFVNFASETLFVKRKEYLFNQYSVREYIV